MLKIRDDVDLKELEKFGFVRDNKYISPKYIIRQINEDEFIQISISEPCINIWDLEDKNYSREIWWQNKKGYGTRFEEKVEPYIQDLIQAGLVEKVKE